MNALIDVDPVTFEVLRHRLSMIVDEAAQVLREVSGSPVASEVGDCNAALMDAEGNSIIVGPQLLSHALSGANTVKYVLAKYRENPGVRPGDMFISNDPYRATPHQNCVVVVAPIFHEGAIAAWSGAGIHLADVGGPTPGQIAVGAQSIFEEPTPMPPVKLVEGGTIRQDILEDYLIRGRTRDANALDLRAKIAANLRLERRFREMVERYGATTVIGVLSRTIDFTAGTVRERLRQIPDGNWRVESFLDYDDRGDVRLYRCRLQLTKTGDHMVFDFRGTSPQAPGVINCTYSGLQIAVAHAMLPLMTWDLPKCPAGLMRTYEIVSEPGTFVHALWPAGVTKATTSAAVAVRQALFSAVNRMYACSETFRNRVMAQGYGYSNLVEISGIDQRGAPFATCLLDHGMSSGSPARSLRDGIHTGGGVGAAGTSLANVEVYEQRYPLLYLARQEAMDTIGAGRYQGGAACRIVVTLHDTERIPDITVHRHGVHVPDNPGLHGGLPGSTNRFVVKRRTNVRDLLKKGTIPTRLEELAGETEVLPGICCTSLDSGDVYLSLNTGGGGYGDPLDRDLDLIERDVKLGYVTPKTAAAIYGAVVLEDSTVARDATRARRDEMRRGRLAKATPPAPSADAPPERCLDGPAGTPVTDRLSLIDHRGDLYYACRCGFLIGKADRDYRDYLPRFDAPCDSAGPYCLDAVQKPEFVLRNYVCPGCGGLVEVELAEHS